MGTRTPTPSESMVPEVQHEAAPSDSETASLTTAYTEHTLAPQAVVQAAPETAISTPFSTGMPGPGPGCSSESLADVQLIPETASSLATPSESSTECSSPARHSISSDSDSSDNDLDPADRDLPCLIGKRPESPSSPSSPDLIPPPTKKIRVESAIRVALTKQADGQSKGLMKWFTQSSAADSRKQNKKVDTMISECLEAYQPVHQMEAKRYEHEKRLQNKARQQKHRQKVYADEITRGIRSPRGSKRRRRPHSSVSLLADINGMSESSIAELSRPHRTFKEKQHLAKKHPQGRKRKNEHRAATYHNWHTPFLWSQIINAASHPSVGWQMSCTQIVRLLKQRDAITFAGLSRTTVDSWIDRTGDKPKWSARALQMAINGNDPGLGNKGGKRGIFVRLQLTDLVAITHPLFRHIFRLQKRQSLID